MCGEHARARNHRRRVVAHEADQRCRRHLRVNAVRRKQQESGQPDSDGARLRPDRWGAENAARNAHGTHLQSAGVRLRRMVSDVGVNLLGRDYTPVFRRLKIVFPPTVEVERLRASGWDGRSIPKSGVPMIRALKVLVFAAALVADVSPAERIVRLRSTVAPRASAGQVNTVPDVARPLPLTAVRLTGGPLKRAQELDAKYLLDLEPDRMLAFY